MLWRLNLSAWPLPGPNTTKLQNITLSPNLHLGQPPYQHGLHLRRENEVEAEVEKDQYLVLEKSWVS